MKKLTLACVSIVLALAFIATVANAGLHIRGIGQISPLKKSVLNVTYSSPYMNIAKNWTPSYSGTVTPANFTSQSFPSGVLPNSVTLSQTALTPDYYGHYSVVSTGISGLSLTGAPPLIVYSGGQQVYPGLGSGFGVGAANGALVNNGAWNIEFAFGDLVTTVQNSSTTPGLVQIISSTATGFSTLSTGAHIQIHNVANLSSTTIWTINKISNNTIDLQGSTYNASMVPATGNPGVSAEAVLNVTSITWSWANSLPVFGAVTHTITSLIFCQTSDLASIQSGRVLKQNVIDSINGIQPRWLRFMDSIAVQATSSQYQYTPSLAFQNYASQNFLPAYYAGTTSGTADNYTVSPSGSIPSTGAYQDGEIIHFKADRSTVNGLPTLAISGRSTGAKPMLTNSQVLYQMNISGQTTGLALTSLVGNGTTTTVTTTANHGFTTGQKFVTNIGGNTPSTFNVSNVMATATGVNTFTYSNTTNATASVQGTFTPIIGDGDIFNMTFAASNIAGGTYTSKYYVNVAASSITATTSSKTLTVSAVASGRVTPGQKISGSGITNSPIVLPYGTNGTTGTGGTGTYALTLASTGTTTITSSTALSNFPTSIPNLSDDMAAVISAVDSTLGAAGYVFVNNGGVGISGYYAPGIGQLTPSVSMTYAGGATSIATPLWGQLTAGSLYTAQYRALLNAWVVNGGGLYTGPPIDVIKEYATRTNSGVWYTVNLGFTQQSAQQLGTYFAQNLGIIPVAVETGNELWNVGQVPNHLSQVLGSALGFPAVSSGTYFYSIYANLAWSVSNILQSVADSYVAAGGNRSKFYLLMEFSGSDGGGCLPGAACAGSQTGGVQIALQGAFMTPTPATFTGTITPNTNGIGATLTVTGLTGGGLLPAFQINGVGVTAGTHIAGCLPVTNLCTGNGTYQLDAVYGSTIGPIAMTATNTTYAALGGIGATPTSNAFDTSPNRPVDKADALGYAIYYEGALVKEGAGTWGGSSSSYAAIFQAANDYAQGIATSNNTLVQNGLNAWSADYYSLYGKTGAANGTNICGFLGSYQTFGFCSNAPNAVITGSTGNTSTLTVTSVASGTITAGMTIGIGGSNTVPVILAYGTSGTTGVGGTGTYALSAAFTPGSAISNTTIGKQIGTVQGWENSAAFYDGSRPAGKANLGIIQYEGSIQQNFCSGNPCPVGNIAITPDTTTLASQFTANGWALDATYGYPSFGAGNTQTAFNVIQLYLAYVNSQQYYTDSLLFMQRQAAIHAARPYFSPAQYGIEGTPGATTTTGAAQWGLYPGDVTTPPLQNYFAQQYFNTN